MEMSTEEVHEFISNAAGRLVIKLPLFRGNDVAIDRAVGFVSALEEAGVDMDVIIFSKNALTHERIAPTGKSTKAKAAQRVIDGLHLDYLPYTDVIIAMHDNAGNKNFLEKLCVRYGILDAKEIMAKK